MAIGPLISGVVVGDRALVARLRALPAAQKAAVDAVTIALGMELESRVKTHYLRGPRPGKLGVVTGRLLSSITRGAPQSRSRFESTSTSAFYYVGTNVKYGAFWEQGIAAHDVFAKPSGPMLHFKINGVDFFRRHVHIPAQAARPFLQPALDDMKGMIADRYRRVLFDATVEGLKP